jgi:hypothetical protein
MELLHSPKTESVRDGRRAERVRLILLLAILLGLTDLTLTVHFMSTSGMIEMNPIARELGESDPVNMAIFKCLTIAVNGGILWAFRRRFSVELGAWITLFVLAGLTVQWRAYLSAICSAEGELICQALASDPRWVSLAP